MLKLLTMYTSGYRLRQTILSRRGEAMNSRSIARMGGAVLVAFAMAGCGSWLQDRVKPLVDGVFPPVDYASAQQEAVNRSLGELMAVKSPSLLLNVPKEELERVLAEQLKTSKIEGLAVESATIEAAPQGFMITANVSGTLPKPKAAFKAAVNGWVAVSLADGLAILQPGFASATLTSLDVDGWFEWGGEAAASAINEVLKGFIANVNSQLRPNEYRIDPTQVGLGGQPIVVDVSNGRKITIPAVTLGKVAALVSPLGLHLIADLDGASTEPATAAETCNKYDCYAEAFWQKADVIRPGLKRGAGGIYLADAFLNKALTPAFPPIELPDMRLEALKDLIQALDFNGQVAMGVSIGAPRLIQAFKQAMGELLPPTTEAVFGEPKFTLGEQSIEVEVPVSGKIDNAKLSYKGKVHAGGVIAPSAESLYYRVALLGLQLDAVEHTGGPISPAAFIGSLNGLIAQLLPFINSAFDKQPISVALPKIEPLPVATKGVKFSPAELTIPPPAGVLVIPRLDTNGLRVLVIEGVGVAKQAPSKTGVGVARAVSGAAISPRLNLEEIVRRGAKISDIERVVSRFNAMAARAIPQVPTPAQGQKPEEYANMLFERMWSIALPDQARWSDGMPDVRAAASTGWIIGAVNTVLQHNRIAIDIPFDSGATRYDTGKIRLAEKLEAKCSPDRSCQRASCPLPSCSTNSCDWNCRRSALGVTFDDPICKTGEAACNARAELQRAQCNINANATQTACNVAEEAKRGACNIQKEAEILGCNIAKEAVAAIRQVDGIGTANGQVHATGGASVGSPVLKFDRGDSIVTLQMNAAASFRMSGDIYFTPYDIGHVLACPFKGRAAIQLDGSVPMKSYTIASKISDGGQAEDGSHRLKVDFSPIRLAGSISPAPVDAIITQNPQIFLMCSPVLKAPMTGAALLGKLQAFGPGDILGAIERAIPGNQDEGLAALKAFTAGKIDAAIPIPPLLVTIPKVQAAIPGGHISLTGVWKEGALVFSGS